MPSARHVFAAFLVMVAVAACGSTSNGSVDAADLAGSIVFVSVQAPGEASLTMATPEGGETQTVVDDVHPGAVLSPPRTRVAWVETTPVDAPDFRSTLWVSDLGGGGKRQLLSRTVRIEIGAWSPDGQRLVFESTGLGIVDVDSRKISSVSIISGGSVDWSPDGRELVVADNGVRILSLETGDERLLTRDVLAGSPTWSPDGREIAYTSSSALAGESAIAVVDIDGGESRRVTGGHYDSEPSWSPDGSQIVFVRGPGFGGDDIREQLRRHEVYIVDRDGSDERRLTENDVEERSPVWGDPEPDRSTEPARSDLVVVPDVSGLALREATERLAAAGLRTRAQDLFAQRSPPDSFGAYRVGLQVPEAGTEVRRGRVVELVVLDATGPFAGRAFDREVWLRHPTCGGDNPRGRMVTALLERHLPRGIARSEVVRLLGKPNRVDGRRIEYALGAWSGFRLDCDLLVVEFDAGGKLVRVDVVQT